METIGFIGLGLMGTGGGSAVGPWMAGRLYDVSGSYTAAFLIAAGAGVVSIIACLYARHLKIRGQGRKPADASLTRVRP